ncbi:MULTISPECIES: arsenate reductase (glutaredoxin) [Ferrimonas]|uniref:arsenate reductase (glutaredoxin) n=1 Tax=Ferrimonas TaxID=44011 RepID=UPI0004059C03|nr:MULTISPECIES: arsenate reductase (glutaredoxin) [Ferrimonas]USD38754.1 arsenate reductase (glutaredoxin) [Ferrimonas sp. SCSIO 43195]
MSNPTQIWHNPRCSKSRQTLALLEQQGITPEIFEYLKTPPTQAQLEQVLALLKLSPRALMRTKEAEYKAQGLADANDAQLIQAMLTTPKLIERPIVVHQQRAAIGRPPEQVLEILD